MVIGRSPMMRYIAVKSASWNGSTLARAVLRSATVRAQIISRTAAMRSSAKNMCSVRHKMCIRDRINAQGEDVVAGIRTPSPISKLHEEMPEVYDQFVEICLLYTSVRRAAASGQGPAESIPLYCISHG